MTMINARNAGPISHAMACTPTKTTTSPAAPRMTTNARGRLTDVGPVPFVDIGVESVIRLTLGTPGGVVVTPRGRVHLHLVGGELGEVQLAAALAGLRDRDEVRRQTSVRDSASPCFLRCGERKATTHPRGC